MKNISFKLLSLFLAILLITCFICCAFTKNYFLSPYQTSETKYGGTLVWGTSNPPTIINPILTQQSVSASLLELIFDPLVQFNENGEIIPCLAESWDISDNGLEYIFHLKKHVLFHDGEELTSDDVKFTYEMISDPKSGSPWRSNTEFIDKIEALDRYTIRFLLKKAFTPMLSKLIREIAPMHILAGKNLKSNAFNYHPIGTGPFKFKKWDKKNNQVELEANSNYFQGRPYLDKLIIKCFPDIFSLWIAFMRQEVDLIKYINFENYKILSKDKEFKVYEIPWGTFYAIVYNLDDPILSDIKVRQAISQAININEIIQMTYESGIICTGPFHPESIGFNKEIEPFKYNPENAKMILLTRGWQDNDDDGILEKGGKKFKITLLVDSRKDIDKKIAKIIHQQLFETGIGVEVKFYEGEREIEQNSEKLSKAQAWLRLFVGRDVSFEDYAFIAVNTWTSKSPSFGKLWNYKNDTVEKLMNEALSTKDKNLRFEKYRQIHKIIYNDQPACFLFFPTGFHAVSAKFQNTDKHFSFYMPTYTIKDWYIDKSSANETKQR